nr:immunoglobulin heavy chain junction region [Mus musculus]
LFTKACLVCLL